MVIRVPYNGSLNACTHTNTSALGLIINNSDRFFIFFLIEDGPAHHHLLGISIRRREISATIRGWSYPE
jgi:hypothetical protein